MRPQIETYFMAQALLTSTRASCGRRRVGCILVDDKNHVLSTGYNGPPSGIANCTDEPCGGFGYKSGEGLDECIAVHAEQNALLQCKEVSQIYAAYVTASPCIHCVKLLMNTPCQVIYFAEEYPHQNAKELWQELGRRWIHIDEDGNFKESINIMMSEE